MIFSAWRANGTTSLSYNFAMRGFKVELLNTRLTSHHGNAPNMSKYREQMISYPAFPQTVPNPVLV